MNMTKMVQELLTLRVCNNLSNDNVRVIVSFIVLDTSARRTQQRYTFLGLDLDKCKYVDMSSFHICTRYVCWYLLLINVLVPSELGFVDFATCLDFVIGSCVQVSMLFLFLGTMLMAPMDACLFLCRRVIHITAENSRKG